LRISHSKKFVFFSKPKCASSTIRKMLNKYSDIISTDHAPYHHHTIALQMKIHFDEMGWDWNSYFKFITMRNPWDMIVSFYHFAKPDINGIYYWEKSRDGIARDSTTRLPFEEWVLNKDIKKSWHGLLLKNGEFHKNTWTNDFSFFTLNNFILDEKGEILVDYIVKVENIEKGLKTVCDKINIPFKRIRKLNKSKHKHYRQYYSEETRKVIEEEFQYDIKIGEYEF
jgi:hypothetical protein